MLVRSIHSRRQEGQVDQRVAGNPLFSSLLCHCELPQNTKMYLFYFISLSEIALFLFLPACHSHEIHVDMTSNETSQRTLHQVPIVDIKLQLLSHRMLLAEHHGNTDQVLSANDFMDVIDILLDRFNCSERLLNTEHMTCAKVCELNVLMQ